MRKAATTARHSDDRGRELEPTAADILTRFVDGVCGDMGVRLELVTRGRSFPPDVPWMHRFIGAEALEVLRRIDPAPG